MAFDAGGAVTERPVRSSDSYLRPRGVRDDVRNAGPVPLAFVGIEMNR